MNAHSPVTLHRNDPAPSSAATAQELSTASATSRCRTVVRRAGGRAVRKHAILRRRLFESAVSVHSNGKCDGGKRCYALPARMPALLSQHAPQRLLSTLWHTSAAHKPVYSYHSVMVLLQHYGKEAWPSNGSGGTAITARRLCVLVLIDRARCNYNVYITHYAMYSCTRSATRLCISSSPMKVKVGEFKVMFAKRTCVQQVRARWRQAWQLRVHQADMIEISSVFLTPLGASSDGKRLQAGCWRGCPTGLVIIPSGSPQAQRMSHGDGTLTQRLHASRRRHMPLA